jgi:dTMP kinase
MKIKGSGRGRPLYTGRAGIIPKMKMARRGKFITFEGLDGTGKSTQMRKLAAVLRAAGHKVVETREPGGTATGEKIRRVLLDSSTEGLAPLAEMALMFAARAQHIAEVIVPALERGHVVLCDRFTDSTEAYQCSGRKLGSAAVMELHGLLCGGLWPDLTILLESDPAMSVGRARRRNRRAARGASQVSASHSSASHGSASHGSASQGSGDQAAHKSAGKHPDENRFEQQNRAFFARVREGYRAIAAREPQRVVTVDAGGTPGQTHRRIVEVVGRKMKLAAKNA